MQVASIRDVTGRGPGRPWSTERIAALVEGGEPRRAGALAGAVVTVPLLATIVILTGLVLLVDLTNDGGWLSALPGLLGVALIMASVVVAGSVAGAAYGPRAIDRPDELRSGSVLGMSIVAVVVGAEVAAVVIGVLAIPFDGPMAPVGALAIGAIAVVGFGLPALFIVVPHSIAWRSIMRRVAPVGGAAG